MRIFADTFFYLALLSARDAAHDRAVSWRGNLRIQQFVTTSWVLIEVADFMELPYEREQAVRLISRLRASSSTKVIPASEQLLQRGLDLYKRRLDKAWSLTDCLSFVVMDDEGLTEALTGDRHYVQAGYQALLLRYPPSARIDTLPRFIDFRFRGDRHLVGR